MRGVFFLALITAKSTCGFREQSSPQLRQAGLESSTSSALTPTSSVTDTPSSSNNTTSDSDLANFGQTMERTDQDFADGLTLDLFSPYNRTLVVSQNTSPLPGSFVSGSNGAPFVALSNYSWIIKLNETANDLIAKIELPYDPVALQKVDVDQGNTYVGVLAEDKKSWIVSETQRNVHVSENKTRIIKMTSLDGEYMLLGRQTADISNIFVQYGQGATRTVNFTGGIGTQETEFIDGLRFTVQSDQPFTMNVDIKNGIPIDALSTNVSALNSFAWVVNTSMPTQKLNNAEIQVPFNRAMLVAKTLNSTDAEKRLVVAKRPLNATTESFTPLSPDTQGLVASENRIKVSGLSQLDGQYVLLVT
ncbi:hypothetical protein COCHEDRAFT_1025009 [Bipolaris maydis C5]|uniref:Uncharacterized protein n=1 Tax=Cochliobolus heterostrophus (strain C5 / ATCC 48332 / race O) TaxID=701091 RepID=M2V9U4_COCH5|nr:hypothetical protein COCHEDRAFT_1025009 [Bipolaris maydis C5]KAH7548940.1 hypothetical protein BM1_10713 [Bipolaris maydis]KAJ5031632.1 hypothetical protein J3E73DRAFT_364713 [Bipolaris maydis]KAJ6273513.1 hypothetical protein PSV08DRAFT_348517 [Bipolaris maydis]KAJ6284730.1 hypothetical protein J3E71DRAFT_339093 [Bipolaris maydis]